MSQSWIVKKLHCSSLHFGKKVIPIFSNSLLNWNYIFILGIYLQIYIFAKVLPPWSDKFTELLNLVDWGLSIQKSSYNLVVRCCVWSVFYYSKISFFTRRSLVLFSTKNTFYQNSFRACFTFLLSVFQNVMGILTHYKRFMF